jgi:hypothetical protein
LAQAQDMTPGPRGDIAAGPVDDLRFDRMRYDEFNAQHDSVMQACLTAQLDADGLVAEILRLSGLRDQLDRETDRQRATEDLAQLEELVALTRRMTPATPASPAYEAATAAFGRANQPAGSAAERIDRAGRGIAEIRALANGVADPDEQHSILRLTEPLAMVIAALEHSPTPDHG